MPEIPVEIVCSYAYADERWKRRIEKHLAVFKRQGLMYLWHDRCITPGTDWIQFDSQVETASVILLLISSDFLASDYCDGVELKRALERHEANEAQAILVLIRPVDWKYAPFVHLQALPMSARPITSWTDSDAALVDVAAGIRRAIEDVSLLASRTERAALPLLWNVPYPRNPFFLGRESELAQVCLQLHVGQTRALSQPQAISGSGGIGKTQLALEYVYRYRHDYEAVLWTHAEDIEALTSSYITIATLLCLPECEDQAQEVIVQAVKAWLQMHHNWLLLMDNADDLSIIPGFLPPVLGGHLLLTTCAAATGRLAHRLEIETFFPDQGALFLLRRAAFIAPDATLEHALPQELELARQISRELLQSPQSGS